MVCSKWMSSMEAVTQGDMACLSAAQVKTHHTHSIVTQRFRTRPRPTRKRRRSELGAALVHLTREAGGGVDPLEQLSHTQLLTMVAVARHHYLTHLHLRLVDGLLVFLIFIFFLLFHASQQGGTHLESCGWRSSFKVSGNLTLSFCVAGLQLLRAQRLQLEDGCLFERH